MSQADKRHCRWCGELGRYHAAKAHLFDDGNLLEGYSVSRRRAAQGRSVLFFCAVKAFSNYS
jgi:hypothetical protein